MSINQSIIIITTVTIKWHSTFTHRHNFDKKSLATSPSVVMVQMTEKDSRSSPGFKLHSSSQSSRGSIGITCPQHTYTHYTTQHGSAVVTVASDSRSRGHGFDSDPLTCQVWAWPRRSDTRASLDKQYHLVCTWHVSQDFMAYRPITGSKAYERKMTHRQEKQH